MRKFLVAAMILMSASAQADVMGMVFLNSKNTEAKMLINETGMDGSLSKFFDQMKVTDTGSGSKRLKQLTLKNGRFGFTCTKGVFKSTPPSTSCAFFMKQGDNAGDTNTLITTSGKEKNAVLSVSKGAAAELNGVFPADASGTVAFVLNLPQNVSFEAKGNGGSTLSVGFSAK